MSTQTTNLKLIKPELTDAADITAMNANWDTLDKSVPNTRKINGKALTSDITLTASEMNAVPTTRKVNGKALSADITLSASDVKALSDGGGELTGSLSLKTAAPRIDLVDTSNAQGGSSILKNAGAGVDYGTYIYDISSIDGKRDGLIINREAVNNEKLLLRIENENDEGFVAHKIYGDHNTFIGLRTYNALSQIGIAAGSDTLALIAANMPNNSIMVVGITPTNARIYPGQYGLLTVKRTSATRIEMTFVTTTGVLYTGFYSITSTGDSWSGWVRSLNSNDSNLVSASVE